MSSATSSTETLDRDGAGAREAWPAPRRLGLLVVLVATAIATAGIATIPFYTRGEPREALAMRAMVEGGGWVLPLRNGELHRKPPFFHWIGAAAGLLLGRVDELTARLPSALSSVLAALVVFVWAGASGGAAGGTLTALVTITSFEWMRAATTARVDMVYATLLTIALLSLDRLLRRAPRELAWRWILYAATAAAVLTKGPIGFVLPALAAAGAACARPDCGLWQRLHPLRAVAVVAALVGTWFVLALREHGSAFLGLVVHENLHHLTAAEATGAGHAHGVPYLLAVTCAGLLPWTLLVPLAIPALRDHRRDPSVALAAIWIIAVFGVHALASAKRAVYVLPAFPAIAFLLVTGVRASRTGRASGRIDRSLAWMARSYGATCIVGAALALAASCGLDVPERLWKLLSERDQLGAAAAIAAAREQQPLFAAAAAGMLGAAALLFGTARTRRWDRLVVTLAAIASMAGLAFNTAIHPALARRQSLKAFMQTVTAIAHPDDPLRFLGSIDPGAVFYAGRSIDRVRLRSTTIPPSYLLLWERDLRQLTGGTTPIEPLAVSSIAVPRKGHLLLVRIPPGGRTNAAGRSLSGHLGSSRSREGDQVAPGGSPY
jgi:4-amino-4-deoxy-L-arabinose transferase-like glycosyltransferase